MHTDLKVPLKGLVYPLPVALHQNQKISDVLAFLRLGSTSNQMAYFYVMDTEERLIGVVTAKKLLLSPPHERVENIMDSAKVFLFEEDTLEKALESFSHNHLLAIPIVDKEHKLRGYVDLQIVLGESVDFIEKERRSDLFQLVGLHLEEGRKVSIFRTYFTRMPWLFCNLLAGFVCATISDIYSEVLGKFLILAMFLPLILSLSESVSMQTVMQTLVFLKRSSIPFKKYVRVVIREIPVVLLAAFSCAIIVGLISPLWGEEIQTSFVMGIGIVISVLISSFVGALLPYFLHRSSMDPKIASGPVALMIADVTTTAIYLILAWYFLL